MKVAIFDTAPNVYSRTLLQRGAMGGTEATVVRIAEVLDAQVLQAGRVSNEDRYRGLNEFVQADAVITLRYAKSAVEAVKRFPRARHFLWLHDLCSPASECGTQLLENRNCLIKHGITVVCVSDFHAEQARSTLKAVIGKVNVARIYNPVVVPIDPTPHVERDPNKLVFFSAPHKGLAHTVRVFKYMRYRNRDLKLVIANPGYHKSPSLNEEGIVDIGVLSHENVLAHVRDAFCTFYPNFYYPETFGLVMAESNALGTPVLTHPIGAATEVLGNNSQLLEIPWRDIWIERFGRLAAGNTGAGSRLLRSLSVFESYSDRIDQWRKSGPPSVALRDEFKLTRVRKDWVSLIERMST